MQELTTGLKTMNVNEIASVFGVSSEAIKKHVRELYPNLMKNGIATVLNESQVLEIKKRMTPTTEVVGAITNIERQETILKAFQYLKEDYDLMKARAENAEQIITTQMPKVEFYNNVANSNDTFEIGVVAKMLSKYGLGRNKLFEFLRSKGVLMANNDPFQKYVDLGWFKIIESQYAVNDKIRISKKTVVFQKGVDGIRKLLEKKS